LVQLTPREAATHGSRSRSKSDKIKKKAGKLLGDTSCFALCFVQLLCYLPFNCAICTAAAASASAAGTGLPTGHCAREGGPPGGYDGDGGTARSKKVVYEWPLPALNGQEADRRSGRRAECERRRRQRRRRRACSPHEMTAPRRRVATNSLVQQPGTWRALPPTPTPLPAQAHLPTYMGEHLMNT
jgi:hypothetical protein